MGHTKREEGWNLHYATIKNCDIANGPGVRISLFVSGCTHRCKGCFNEVAWDFEYGEPFTQETVDYILSLLAPSYVKGLTLLGGEPFEPQNQPALVDLLRQVKAKYPEKSIWAFSGYLFDRDMLSGRLGDSAVLNEFLGYLDVLVDGPFVESKKDLTLRFRGSSNQRLIDVPASLSSGTVVLWQDWQGNERGMK
jgi:anaerobic ribonucleoside-triphosphate reductase activating protein